MPDPAAVVLAGDLEDVDRELVATGVHVATAGAVEDVLDVQPPGRNVVG